MTRFGCLRMGLLLDRRPSSLSDSERLMLERHLTACDECARSARVVRLARELTEEALAPARPRSYQRAIARALQSAGESPGEAAVRARPRRARAGLALAAVAAGAVAASMLATQRPPASPRDFTLATADPPMAENAGRLVAGRARADGRALSPGDALPPNRPVFSRTGAELSLAHARVELGASTGLSWTGGEMTVHLHVGDVRVSVDPDRGELFRVATDRFIVEVAGTVFRVDAAGVEVFQGAVRVLGRDGSELVARVAAGASWRSGEAGERGAAEVESMGTGGDASDSLDDRAESDAAGDSGRTEATPPAADETARRAPPRRAASPSVAELLDRARRALHGGNLAAADVAARAALSAHPSRAQAAEAEILLAECAQTAGDLDLAGDLYLRVLTQYRELPAAETALFAAARARANAGRGHAARALLLRYLETYPEGRFRHDAAVRLRALEDPR